MEWKLDKDRPICPQLCEKLCVMIANGDYKPDERLLSVRDVALNAGVNPNTVQKSFEQLERQDLIYSVRGSGWYVKGNVELAKKAVQELVDEKTKEYFMQMQNLGFDEAKTKEIIERWNKNE